MCLWDYIAVCVFDGARVFVCVCVFERTYLSVCLCLLESACVHSTCVGICNVYLYI